jgi:hypothetical protein
MKLKEQTQGIPEELPRELFEHQHKEVKRELNKLHNQIFVR